MKQPIKGKKRKIKPKTVKVSPKYGISKLEKYFAENFLDKLGLKYIYQFEATQIKRFYDFAVILDDRIPIKLELKEGLNSVCQTNDSIHFISFCIEIDGDYFHSNPKTVNENKLNPMQKHNKMVDKYKDLWAKSHGIPLLRIWEYDIRHDGSSVLKKLKKYVADKLEEMKRVDKRRLLH